MNKTYVYLIGSQKRLTILNMEIKSSDYTLLVAVDGFNALAVCKMFCIGYLMGNVVGKETGNVIVNDVREFS